MRFRIKQHYYQGDGWLYDVYWFDEEMNNWTRYETPFNSLTEAEEDASVIKRFVEAEMSDEVVSEFEL